MDEKRTLQGKNNHRRQIGRLRFEVDGEIFQHLLWTVAIY
jgi:hypothetical protein